MEDWAMRLDRFLAFDDRNVLEGAGTVSADAAKEFAESEFETYRIVQDRLFESDFDRIVKETKPLRKEQNTQSEHSE